MWINLREAVEELFRPLGQVFGFEIPFYILNPEKERLDERDRRGTKAVAHACPVCGKSVAFRDSGRGRQRIYCGNKCKWQAWKLNQERKK